jgi:hypothetical protein
MLNRCPPRLQGKFVKNFTLSAGPNNDEPLPPATGRKIGQRLDSVAAVLPHHRSDALTI